MTDYSSCAAMRIRGSCIPKTAVNLKSLEIICEGDVVYIDRDVSVLKVTFTTRGRIVSDMPLAGTSITLRNVDHCEAKVYARELAIIGGSGDITAHCESLIVHDSDVSVTSTGDLVHLSVSRSPLPQLIGPTRTLSLIYLKNLEELNEEFREVFETVRFSSVTVLGCAFPERPKLMSRKCTLREN